MYILKVDVEYPKKLHKKHNKLPFFAERMNIGKVKKIKNLNQAFQAFQHGLQLKMVHQIPFGTKGYIRFEQNY